MKHFYTKPSKGMKLRALCAAVVACAVLAVLAGGPAYAWADNLAEVEDALSSAKDDLARKTDELSELARQVEDASKQAEQSQEALDALVEQISESQDKQALLAKRLAKASMLMYKSEGVSMVSILMSSESINDLLGRFDQMELIAAQVAQLAAKEKKAEDELAAQYREASQQRDDIEASLAQLRDDKQQLDALLEDLEKRVSELEDEQRRAIEEAKNAASHLPETFDSGDTTGWRTGVASAYGGSSDPSTPNPGVTATGAVCDDWSIGVAVPMAWGPAAYYGRMVEISYGGKSVIVPVNDCGGMGGGSRVLDLQPGVFKAFGFSTCNDWGLRTVSYRFL